MLKFEELKVGDKFYLFDRVHICFDDAIVECEVIKRNKTHIRINVLNRVYPGELKSLEDIKNVQLFFVETYLEDHMFEYSNLKEACEFRDEYVRIENIGLDNYEFTEISGLNLHELGELIDNNE